MQTEDTDSIQKPRKSILLINKHPNNNNRSEPLTWCLGFPKWGPLAILFTFVQNLLYFVPRGGCNVLLICTNQIWIENFDPVKVPLVLLGQTWCLAFPKLAWSFCMIIIAIIFLQIKPTQSLCSPYPSSCVLCPMHSYNSYTTSTVVYS